MKNHNDTFLENWNRFCTDVRANIRERGKNQPITLSTANAVLMDVKSNWTSPYEANGRWLNEFISQHPQQGDQIKLIITQKIRFMNELKPISTNKSSTIGVSAVTGILGVGIASALGASMLVRIAALVIPGAVVYQTLNTVGDSKKRDSETKTGIEYTNQLNEFRDEILEILSHTEKER